MVKITIPRAVSAAVLAGAITAGLLYQKEEKFPPALERQLELLTEEAKRYCNHEILEAADVMSLDTINQRKEAVMLAHGYNPDCLLIDCRQRSSGYNLKVEVHDCHKK